MVILEDYLRREGSEDCGRFGILGELGDGDGGTDGRVTGIFLKIDLLVHRLDDLEILELLSFRHLFLGTFFVGLRRHSFIFFEFNN